MKQVLGGLCLLAALGGAVPVLAKPLSEIIRNTGLTPDDFAIMKETAQSLFVTSTPSVGREKTWSNPDSKSQGTVRLMSVQGNCVVVRHSYQAKGSDKTGQISNRQCKTADGKWVLEP